jgi:hypothetical protein
VRDTAFVWGKKASFSCWKLVNLPKNGDIWIYMGEKGFIFKLVRVTIHCKWMPKSGLKSRPKPGIQASIPGFEP